MKRFAVAATVLSVAFGAQALAQQIAVEVAPDTRTTIKEYVVKEKIRPVTVKERVGVGVAVPTDIQLTPLRRLGVLPSPIITTSILTTTSCWSSRRAARSSRSLTDAPLTQS